MIQSVSQYFDSQFLGSPNVDNIVTKPKQRLQKLVAGKIDLVFKVGHKQSPIHSKMEQNNQLKFRGSFKVNVEIVSGLLCSKRYTCQREQKYYFPNEVLSNSLSGKPSICVY